MVPDVTAQSRMLDFKVTQSIRWTTTHVLLVKVLERVVVTEDGALGLAICKISD
jgi:hypothetical protein